MLISNRYLAAILLATSAVSFSLPAKAQVPEFGGVKIEDSITIYNNTLLLNGAAVLTASKAKQYVVQIYAKQKFGTLDELMAAPGPKRLILTALKEVDTAAIVKIFNRNLEAGNRNDMAKLVPGMVSIGNLFKVRKNLLPGEVLTMDWIPIFGFTVSINGKVQGEAHKPPELFKAAVGVWIGDSPIEPAMKLALLGKG